MYAKMARFARVLLATLGGFCVMSSISIMPASAAKSTAAASPFVVLGMGCFWGAEKRMKALNGVVDVEAGYAGGDDVHPTYESVSAHHAPKGGSTHAEVVKVSYDPKVVSFETVLAKFWESHNPTQGNRQGNDIGESYRSIIFYQSEAEKKLALHSLQVYQQNLTSAGKPAPITTQIVPLKNYSPAENYHQDYLLKNPQGYCGLGGLGVVYADPALAKTSGASPMNPAVHAVNNPWQQVKLNSTIQIIAFEAEECGYCKKFNADIFAHWKSTIPLVKTFATAAPSGWTLGSDLFATPTIVLFKQQKEVARFTGYTDEKRFWQWLGYETLSDKQKQIAFNKGTERPFTGSLLDEKRSGVFVDPITHVPLFRSGAKFNSGTGWPSFFEPLPNAVVFKKESGADTRTEVLSASSGIHLGHVFDDGPPPTGKRFCINSDVLTFVPDAVQAKTSSH